MKEFSFSKTSRASKRVQLKKTLRVLNKKVLAADIVQNQQYKFGEGIDKEEAEHQKTI